MFKNLDLDHPDGEVPFNAETSPSRKGVTTFTSIDHNTHLQSEKTKFAKDKLLPIIGSVAVAVFFFVLCLLLIHISSNKSWKKDVSAYKYKANLHTPTTTK